MQRHVSSTLTVRTNDFADLQPSLRNELRVAPFSTKAGT